MHLVSVLCIPVSSISTSLSFLKSFCPYMISIQISLNVMKTMVAVVRYATTLKEALNAHVEMVMNWILMDKIVRVHNM